MFLNEKECEVWCEENGTPRQLLRLDETPALSFFFFSPPKKFSLLLELVSKMLACVPPPSLFWICDWPFCTDDQMALISFIRKGLGEEKSLIESPGHVVDETVIDLLPSELALMIAFNWDSHLIASGSRVSISTTHHGFIRVIAKDNDDHQSLQELVKSHGASIEQSS